MEPVISNFLRKSICRFGFGKNPKVFGIGRNKTGTTSLEAALVSLGYRVAPTREGECLFDDWTQGRFAAVKRLCKSYDAFQDIPFSFPGSYEILDQMFPGSKFVLTVRDLDKWFQSLVRFHSKLFGNGKQPTWEDLEAATYRRRGFIADCQRFVYEADTYGLYDEEHYKAVCQRQIETAREYFRNRSDQFLEIDVSEEGSFQRLCGFLGQESDDTKFPWENKT